MGYTWVASNTKHALRKSTYSYRNAAALIPNKNRYTTPLSLYYSPPNGIFSMLFLSLNSSLEYCFTLSDIRNVHTRQETDRLVSIASMDVAELRGA